MIGGHILCLKAFYQHLIRRWIVIRDQDVLWGQITIRHLVLREIRHRLDNTLSDVPELLFRVEGLAHGSLLDILSQVVLVILKEDLDLVEGTAEGVLLLEEDLHWGRHVGMGELVSLGEEFSVGFDLLFRICLSAKDPK